MRYLMHRLHFVMWSTNVKYLKLPKLTQASLPNGSQLASTKHKARGGHIKREKVCTVIGWFNVTDI